MQKKVFISWLCLIFLSTFFVGCKPQEKPIVPKKKKIEVAKKVVQKTDLTTEKVPEISPEKEGVIITAILVDKPEKINNLIAVIKESNQRGLPKTFVSTTNIIKNKIVFPAIPPRFRNLQVSVCGENIPQCFSEKFSTTDGKDKEVIVEIPMNVTLKGTALMPNGSPFTNKFFIFASSVDKSKEKYQTGEIQEKSIQPAESGKYKFPQLAQGFFNIDFYHQDYKPFETNLCQIPPETELNFSFSDFPTLKLKGKVIHSFDKKPLEGIEVCARKWQHLPPYDSDTTDSEGKFSLDLKESSGPANFFGEITIDEPGFGGVKRQINESDRNSTITISLLPAGYITGKITDSNGNPLSGLIVEADNDNFIPTTCYDNLEYYSLPSDINGIYVISNVTAPMEYGVLINKHSYYKQQDYTIPDKTFSVKVEIGKTAVCDLVANSKSVILIKAHDDKKKTVFNYTLDYKVQSQSGWCGRSFKVNLSEGDWYYLDFPRTGGGTFSCTAYNRELGLSVKTNNIFFAEGTNYIVLKMMPLDVQLNLSGFLTGVDGLPAKDGYVIASPGINNNNNKTKKGDVDDSGFFKIEGLNVKKGKMLRVQMVGNNNLSTSFTNLLNGSENVELKITKPKKIIGQVFYDNLDTPASNFVVECRSIYKAKQGFSPINGKFSFKYSAIYRPNLKYSGTITISAENYFPTKTKFNLKNKFVCDVGKIILKSGKTATLRGRLVNQYGKPIEKRVYLKYKNKDEKNSALANIIDGIFVFEDVLPGKATIYAKSWFGFSASNSFEISEGDNLELPDLVLNYIDAAFVVMKFKLPNGTYVRATKIINNGYFINYNCELSRDVHTGTHSGWKINYNDKIYVVDDFVITETTDRLEVQMQEEIK